jgi:hypothetical protein
VVALNLLHIQDPEAHRRIYEYELPSYLNYIPPQDLQYAISL